MSVRSKGWEVIVIMHSQLKIGIYLRMEEKRSESRVGVKKWKHLVREAVNLGHTVKIYLIISRVSH